MISRLLSSVCLLWVLLPLNAMAGELFPFAMPWDDASSNLTNLSGWNQKPAGKNGFVRACGSHLCVGSERIRFLGVNIEFGSVAPTHEQADKIAARLARFGVNIVRFHHMDSQPAPNGLLQKDMKTFDPAVLERFDYFVAALKKEGIYSNINLHVGRKYPGFKDWGEDTPKYWKGVDNFYQPMIAMQKDFARELLTHRNPHTGTRYVEEPAVAFVEINNENGLIDEWRKGNLDGMTDPYRTELSRLWQVWLKERYKSDESLRAAWGVRETPLGKEMLGAKVDVKSGEAGWNLQLVGGAEAKLAAQGNGLTLAMTKPGKENWHIQLHQNSLAVQADQPYTLVLKLKADQSQKVNLALMQAHAPWQRLWSQDVRIGTDWQNVAVTFAPPQGEAQARLTVTGLGLSTGQLQIADASLKPGGLAGLRARESLETDNVAISSRGDYQNRTPSGQRDWLQFLWQTETSYWTGMQRFVKNDLGGKALIIGTQAHYSPAPIQAQLDVVDNHAYWQHPRFPGKPWDQDNWNIINSPMAGVANGGTLPELALRRVPGKPYVITEYNHSAPSHYQGEALPLLAAYGALQDWDGLFLYSYGAHGMNWNPGYINNFFDSHANPVKMASLIASAALWRRGDVKTPGLPVSQSLPGVPRWIETLRTTGQHPSAEQLGAQRGAAFLRPVSLATPPGIPSTLPWLSETHELVWGYAAGKTVTVDTPRSKAVIGAKTTKVVLSGVEMELVEARNDTAVLLATVLDGKDFASPGRILFTTLGQVENTGQQWDDKKTTLGRRLGKAPTRIEGIGARLSLPVSPARVKAWALDERGNRREAIRIGGEQKATLEVSEEHRTLWYELEIR